MLFALALLAALPGTARPEGAPADLNHHDTVDPSRFPWSSVAKLFNSVGGACTGAVIARDRVLTAAHCLYAFRTRRFLPPDAIHVLLGYDRGDYREHARVARYRVGPGYDPQAERSTVAQDWAVLELTEPLPASIVPLKLADALPSPGTPIMVGGFARDRAFRMTADSNCAVTGIADAKVITHGCVIQPGDSGAPLLTRGKGVEVLGVAVGIWRQGDRAVNVASPTPPAVLDTAVLPR